MNVKKRKKVTRARGSTTHGWGARQRHKGHGCSGGFGLAGTGKRGDQKKQSTLMMAQKKGFKTYFGKQGMTSCSTERKTNNVLNLTDIQNNFEGNKIDLKNYKILGHGEGFKAEIIAKTASKTAITKMEKAGGKIILPIVKEKKTVKKVSVPKENASEKVVPKKSKKVKKKISQQ